MIAAILRAVYFSSGLNQTSVGRALRAVRSARADRSVSGPTSTEVAVPAEGPANEGILVAFRVSGGIGDHLIAARYIRDLVAAAGGFRFDVFSSRPEILDFVFGGVPGFNTGYSEYFAWHVKHYYRSYPLAIWVSHFAVSINEPANWAKLHRECGKLVRICEYLDRFRGDHMMNPLIDAHPMLDGQLGAKAVFMNLDRHRLAHAMSRIPYAGPTLDVAQDPGLRAALGLDQRPYVTVHNGFDAEFQTSFSFATRSTKVYPHYGAVIRILRDRHPELAFVQLGTKTSKPVPGIDHQLIGKTTLEETAALLAGAAVHLDNESGLVHLAACVGTVSCVLFGPTPAPYFGYAGNLNVSPRVCGGCWWSSKNWMTDCPRGMQQPVCLWETPPEAVAELMSDFLRDGSKPRALDRVAPPCLREEAA